MTLPEAMPMGDFVRLVIPIDAIEVQPDAFLAPQARVVIQYRGSQPRIYVGPDLFREMCGAESWPAWARDVFWSVT